MRNYNILKNAIINIKKIFTILFLYDRCFIFGIALLSIVTSVLPIMSILITQELINSLQQKNQDLSFVMYILAMYLLVKLLLLLLNNLNSYLFNKYNDYLMVKLNIYFQKKCAELEFCDFENSKVYDMLQRAEQQIGVRPISLVRNIASLLSSLVSFIGAMIILTKWNIWALIGFILLPVLSYKYFSKINKLEFDTIYKRADKERKSWYLIHLLIKDYFVKEVRMLGITNYIIANLEKIKEYIYKENKVLNFNRLKFNIFYQVTNFIFSSSIIIYAIYETVIGKILVGNLLTYINTTNRLESSITSITSSIFSIYTDSMYCENIITFFDFIDKKEKYYTAEIKIGSIQTIELINISFQYPNTDKFVLKNISLSFEIGNIYTLVGENGSGKTTLIKIICGIYKEYTGDILIDGINLRDIDIQSYQDILSVVFQDFNNYEFSIRDNITLGDIKNRSEFDRTVHASVLSGADGFVKKMPNGYNQQVGTWFDYGIQLSGGQWQKLAIARGLFREASMYIFDEPTASLDPSAEYVFFKNIITKAEKKITLFVTHRFINAQLADKIFVLKNGILVESGIHEKLLELDREYAKLYKMQLGKIDY